MRTIRSWALLALLGFGWTAMANEAQLSVVKPEQGMAPSITPLSINLITPVGLPWGDWNVMGLQTGIWNDVDEFWGLQIGLVNIARQMRGVQIGLVNVILDSDVVFFPVINAWF